MLIARSFIYTKLFITKIIIFSLNKKQGIPCGIPCFLSLLENFIFGFKFEIRNFLLGNPFVNFAGFFKEFFFFRFVR